MSELGAHAEKHLTDNSVYVVTCARWIVSAQSLQIYNMDPDAEATSGEKYLQRWITALLLSSANLTTLSVLTDGVPWPPVLGLIPVRHLSLHMRWVRPWLDVITTDLSVCSCLETLSIRSDCVDDDSVSNTLPDLFLHDVVTLKSVELYGWFPKEAFTLPPECLLRLAVSLETHAEWHQWQVKGCPISVLYLVCMELQAWPGGIQEMSGLRFLDLYCKKFDDQDLAALQHIPHVHLAFTDLSTLRVSSGSWRSLNIWGQYAAFSIDFSNVDAFVRDTERFHFMCTSQEAAGVYKVLRAACMRQGVACYKCEQSKQSLGHPDGIKVVSLSNVKLCLARHGKSCAYHEDLLPRLPAEEIWPSPAIFPELYRQEM